MSNPSTSQETHGSWNVVAGLKAAGRWPWNTIPYASRRLQLETEMARCAGSKPLGTQSRTRERPTVSRNAWLDR